MHDSQVVCLWSTVCRSEKLLFYCCCAQYTSAINFVIFVSPLKWRLAAVCIEIYYDNELLLTKEA